MKIFPFIIKTNSKDLFFILLYMAMILIGSPSHLLVKFRPMHIIPWLADQTFLGQIGIIFLISYATKMLLQSSLKKKITITVIIAIWLNIIMCGFVKGKFYEFGSSYPNLINPILLKTLQT